VTDLPPLPVEPTDDPSDDGGDDLADFVGDRGDPWPVWCECTALALDAGAVCLIAGAVLVAVGVPLTGSAVGISAGDRLRYAAENVGFLPSLLAFAAALLVGADGITSGERRGPATDAGRIAVYTAGVIGLIVAMVSVARTVDILTGHVNVVGPATPAHYAFRAGFALDQVVGLLVGGAACWLAFRVLDDRDRVADEFVDQPEEQDDEDGMTPEPWSAPPP